MKEVHGYNIEYPDSSDTIRKIVKEWEEHSGDSLDRIFRQVREKSEKKLIIGDEENVVLKYEGGQEYSLKKKEY